MGSVDAEQCHECQSIDIVTDFANGDVICRSCGIVIGDRIIDQRDEIRIYEEDQGTNVTSRRGDVMDPRLGNESASTFLSFQNKSASNSEEKQDQAKKKKVASLGTSKSPIENGFVKIDELAVRLNLPKAVTEAAKTVYCRTNEKVSKVSRSTMDKTVAAVLYIACRQSGSMRTMKEFALATGLEKRIIGKSFKHIARSLDLELGVVTVEDYVTKYGNALNIPRKIQLIAVEVAKKASSLEFSIGTNPSCLAATAVYFCAAIMDVKRSLPDVAEASSVSVNTLKKLGKEFNNIRFQLFEGIKLN